jgi:hypothetical protein
MSSVAADSANTSLAHFCGQFALSILSLALLVNIANNTNDIFLHQA